MMRFVLISALCAQSCLAASLGTSTWGKSSFLPSTATIIENVLAYGDSKVMVVSGGTFGYIDYLQTNAGISEIPTRISHGGYGVVIAAGGGCFTNVIDSDLASASGTPDAICLNIGTNDPGMQHTNDGRFVFNYNLILDALHAKWPNARIGCALPWSGQAPDWFWDEVAGAIQAIVAERAYCVVGPDERGYLKDNKETYFSDQPLYLHPNAAGHVATGVEWKTVFGL